MTLEKLDFCLFIALGIAAGYFPITSTAIPPVRSIGSTWLNPAF